LQAIETTAVVVGVGFGLAQLSQLRIQREVEAGLELLRPLQSLESAEALMILHGLPDDLSSEELRTRLGDEFEAVLATAALFESLGPLVARGHVPFGMYAEYYRGPTVLTWRKLRRYVEEQRQAGWPTLFEWLQWLAERMAAIAPDSSSEPAFQRFRTWRHPRDYRRLRRGVVRADNGEAA
jgi:hypothetical protein